MAPEPNYARLLGTAANFLPQLYGSIFEGKDLNPINAIGGVARSLIPDLGPAGQAGISLAANIGNNLWNAGGNVSQALNSFTSIGNLANLAALGLNFIPNMPQGLNLLSSMVTGIAPAVISQIAGTAPVLGGAALPTVGSMISSIGGGIGSSISAALGPTISAALAATPIGLITGAIGMIYAGLSAHQEAKKMGHMERKSAMSDDLNCLKLADQFRPVAEAIYQTGQNRLKQAQEKGLDPRTIGIDPLTGLTPKEQEIWNMPAGGFSWRPYTVSTGHGGGQAGVESYVLVPGSVQDLVSKFVPMRWNEDQKPSWDLRKALDLTQLGTSYVFAENDAQKDEVAKQIRDLKIDKTGVPLVGGLAPGGRFDYDLIQQAKAGDPKAIRKVWLYYGGFPETMVGQTDSEGNLGKAPAGRGSALYEIDLRTGFKTMPSAQQQVEDLQYQQQLLFAQQLQEGLDPTQISYGDQLMGQTLTERKYQDILNGQTGIATLTTKPGDRAINWQSEPFQLDAKHMFPVFGTTFFPKMLKPSGYVEGQTNDFTWGGAGTYEGPEAIQAQAASPQAVFTPEQMGGETATDTTSGTTQTTPPTTTTTTQPESTNLGGATYINPNQKVSEQQQQYQQALNEQNYWEYASQYYRQNPNELQTLITSGAPYDEGRINKQLTMPHGTEPLSNLI